MSAAGEPTFVRRHLGPLTVLIGLLITALVGSLSAALREPSRSAAAEPRARPGPFTSTKLNRQHIEQIVLRRQQQALRSGSRASYLATWGHRGSVTRRASAVYENVRALNAVVTLRRSGGTSAPGVPANAQESPSPHSWTADVQVDWRLRGFFQQAATAQLTYTFARRGDSVVVTDVRAPAGEPVPAWLLPSLDVLRSPRTLAAATSHRRVERVHRLLDGAEQNLTRVIPFWHGVLVAFEPRTSAQFESLLGAEHHSYSAVAAVTATVDGSTGAKAPVAIFINPRQFKRLSPVGAAVVVTHEATHAATGATAPGLPLWVVEGFADYVAITSMHVPLPVWAAALISDIRKHGVPAALPSNSAFTTSADSAQSSEVYYEQAQLAARLIARTYGQQRLLTFYREVLTSGSVERALRTVLGTSRIRFTSQWRHFLTAIARAG